MRNRKRYSQREVAELIGVETNTYANWEANTTTVKSDKLMKLAEVFEVEIGDIFKDPSPKVEIHQQNTDNKDHSINGLIFIVTDKDSVSQITDILKSQIQKTPNDSISVKPE